MCLKYGHFFVNVLEMKDCRVYELTFLQMLHGKMGVSNLETPNAVEGLVHSLNFLKHQDLETGGVQCLISGKAIIIILNCLQYLG